MQEPTPVTLAGSDYLNRFHYWFGNLNPIGGSDVYDRLDFVYNDDRQAVGAYLKLLSWSEQKGVGGFGALESVLSGSASRIRTFVDELDSNRVPIQAQPGVKGGRKDVVMTSSVVAEAAEGDSDAGLTEHQPLLPGGIPQTESPQATSTQPSLDRSSHSPATDGTISPAATAVDGGTWRISADSDSSVVGRPMVRRRPVSKVLRMSPVELPF